jgi:NTP pyrophosphatase (non-canonical NTP hydrolase)
MSVGSETDFAIPPSFNLEETYELSDAILQDDLQEIKKSLEMFCFIWFFMLK